MPSPAKPTTSLTREELRQAVRKDFHELLVKEFTADWKIQRLLHDLELDVMDFDNTMQLFDTYVKTEVNENSKAYGGCLDCYGKGYATQESATIGYPDFVVDKGFKHHEHKMIFCECPRGRQLRSEIDLQADKENI